MLLVPYIQIRSNSIYSFTVNEDRSDYSWKKRFDKDENGLSLQDRLYQNLQEHATYTGTVRPGTKKRLTKAIEFMVMSTPQKQIFNPVSHRKQPFKLSFVTLTVYSTDRNITGKECHKTCLEPFIKWMRDNYNVRSYIWKAELQKRGQIHYHLTLDTFIHWQAMRDKWNALQQRAGYLDRYFEKYGHYDANSIDVHSVKKKSNLTGYLIKEIAKSFQNDTTIGGKIWDCSLNLKACKYFTVHEDLDYSWINHLKRQKLLRCIETDHCYIYETVKGAAETFLSPNNLKLYNEYMTNVRNSDVKAVAPVKKAKEQTYIHPPIVPVTIIKQEKTLFYKPIPIGFDIDIGCFSSS